MIGIDNLHTFKFSRVTTAVLLVRFISVQSDLVVEAHGILQICRSFEDPPLEGENSLEI